MHRREPNRKNQGNKRKGGSKDEDSVHRKNLHIFAQPLVFLFNTLGLVVFNIWIILSALCSTITQKSKLSAAATKQLNDGSNHDFYRQASSEERPPPSPQPVGPAEPALAKQKHHHRKAFEYISKALKLDEEEKGRLLFLINSIYIVACQRSGVSSKPTIRRTDGTTWPF